ncbi:hypothetical protein TcasGA2_TC034856 [Tribolium castaneum]|uniref:Odorant receptor n=1 Tax=Tribolium castaneum TaxID=7070 RepID=A0A139WCJ0_TRICA|nr:hypothetical protein TcasGA2_TC034856 [Tribolium castaneum]
MFRNELQDDGDLRTEIFHLKKNLSNISTENRMLKVKIRKLQNEIIKKDKQIDAILDPKKNKYSDDLNWDNEIGQIQIKVPTSKNVKHTIFNDEIKKKTNRSLSWTCEAESSVEFNKKHQNERSKSGGKDQYKNFLSTIKDSNSRQTSSRKSSPESDLERIELLCESPHEEIQQLHSYFLDIIAELGHLKNTVTELQIDKNKTDSAIKKENFTIDMLAKELKNLRLNKPKPNRNYSRRFHSADLVAKVYTANKVTNKSVKENKSKDKTKGKKTGSEGTNGPKFKFKNNKTQGTKSVMVQVDDLNDNTEFSNQCLYIERDNITIKEKSKSPDDREDEVLTLMLTTSVWFFCIIMHIIMSTRSHLDLHVSEDVAYIVVFCGLYYITFNYVKNQHKIALLLRDLSNFDKFGVPPGYENVETKLGFYSKFLFAYVTVAGVVYNFMRFIEKGECENMTGKDFNEVCGLMSPLWIPISLNNNSLVYCAIFLYVLICSQMVIKVGLMISYHATEMAHHIILRIDHLKLMIVKCFDLEYNELQRRKLRQCILYHTEILDFASRLDECFSTGMFTHIFMTGAIFACIEKQFIDGEHQFCAAVHFIGWVLTLFVACLGGQHLINAWYKADKELRKDLLFMLMRCQKSLKIRAGPFGVLSYPLLVSVLKMSYSMLCMLTS